jgi:hypothetical protein
LLAFSSKIMSTWYCWCQYDQPARAPWAGLATI